MKDRLTTNLSFYRNVFILAAAVHKQATMKYERHGWEKISTDEVDASAHCSLDAMVRHTLKLCAFEEYEEQSTLHHACHIAARIQMFTTINHRNSQNHYVRENFIDPDLLIVVNPEVAKMNIVSDIKQFETYITPEFIDLCMAYDISSTTNEYANQSWYSGCRSWLATLLGDIAKLDEIHEIDFNTRLHAHTMAFLQFSMLRKPNIIVEAQEMLKK